MTSRLPPTNRTRRAIKDAILTLFCCFIVVNLYGPMREAKWSVYADHEIQVYLGYGGAVPLTSIPKLLLETEVGYPGQVSRYRPTTYLGFITEAFLWGNNPERFHLARICMCALFFVALAIGFGRFFSLPLAAALTVFLMTASYWPGVWIGFGPNEQYAAVLLVVFCWSYTWLHGWPLASAGDNRSKPFAWALCTISAAFLLGVKENFFVILGPMAWLAYISWIRQKRTDYRLALLLGLFAWATFLFTVIVIGVMKQGVDFYGHSVSVWDRGLNLLSVIFHSSLGYMICVVLALTGLRLITQIFPPKNHNAEIKYQFTVAIALQAALLIFGLTHAFFYGGWPTDSRYAFPGELFVFLSAVQLGYLALALVSIVKAGSRFLLEGAATAILLFATHSIGFDPLHRDITKFVQASLAFTQQIDSVMALAKRNPEIPIVVESATPYDFEPVFSVDRFLKMGNVTSPIFLRLHNLAEAQFPREPFFFSLIEGLKRISTEGKIPPFGVVGTLPSAFLVEYIPIGELPESGRCFSIRLAAAPVSPTCEVIADIKY